MNQITANIFVETRYEGVNVGAINTSDGIIAIDAPSYTQHAREWVVRLSTMHPKPVQNLILTDYNGDRILNSRWFNADIITHTETANKLIAYQRRYPAEMLDSLMARNYERGLKLSNSPVEKPTISFQNNCQFFKGQYEIQLIAAPGPTLGNIWVFIPEARVIFVGDTLTTNMPPLIYDGCSGKWLDSLALLKSWQDKVDTIVPGRGEMGTVADIDALCHYLRLMQQRMEQLINEKRPYAETATYITEFIDLYPHHNLPMAWLRNNIQHTLNQVYHEINFRNDGIVVFNEEKIE